MRLNTISSAPGAKQAEKRVGRGIGSGWGKTCGRGHKGQKSRSGGFHKVGFEGGQMPLQRRVPKFGFSSRKARFRVEVRLDQLTKVNTDTVDIAALVKARLIPKWAKRVKVIASGKLDKPVSLQGIMVSAGARRAIEAAGGRIGE
ncbi:50S ribosomal protein L15 [Nitrosococcus oceani]|uniref:Large ribosomal subunit protein uL15 n=2 Tax=Nitrosococcus oceani TaxID=1229 RepID=RL15_NITOC|nr:50S ribosomal protein L15 [Nitrosococcus oceani]Q3J8T2.1 RecName: Full=Large ribosomal subunit protein uL15; AltName: Full=50S ribosomal protein L15 [Nitrosococcus oceani ATCC 19707]KFI18842.1 50S ribosomal protein L15 [Nitrosococcus oceani C-27]ABA58764.1 LSU ribosomal protein L15P [Nitrosococcus oceani ATCC 19707]KFI22064.1 50S ribosomal protein L15 [Nitrosococcus oceani]GEM19146.1 50S ribosomal protein L15 [Nitrosococcus oceani]